MDIFLIELTFLGGTFFFFQPTTYPLEIHGQISRTTSILPCCYVVPKIVHAGYVVNSFFRYNYTVIDDHTLLFPNCHLLICTALKLFPLEAMCILE